MRSRADNNIPGCIFKESDTVTGMVGRLQNGFYGFQRDVQPKDERNLRIVFFSIHSPQKRDASIFGRIWDRWIAVSYKQVLPLLGEEMLPPRRGFCLGEGTNINIVIRITELIGNI